MNAQVPHDWSSQEVTYVEHPVIGRIGAIVVDSTTLGPALGGCRFWSYESIEHALIDGRRLARGMSYKNALAGLPLGGGKSVLAKPAGDFDRSEIFRAFAHALDSLGGEYVTAEDVGTKVEDMELVRSITPHVYGVSAASGRAGGDPSPWTAQGVFASICAVADLMEQPVAGMKVAVQGLGNVGMCLAELLHDRGAELTVADINTQSTNIAVNKFGAKVASASEIHKAEVDVFAPCALGAILNETTIPDIRARAIVGAANNQLATEQDGKRIMSRGILYAPDYVVNAGGVINVAGEYFKETPSQVSTKVEKIGERLIDILSRARELAVPTNVAADMMAREIMHQRS